MPAFSRAGLLPERTSPAIASVISHRGPADVGTWADPGSIIRSAGKANVRRLHDLGEGTGGILQVQTEVEVITGRRVPIDHLDRSAATRAAVAAEFGIEPAAGSLYLRTVGKMYLKVAAGTDGVGVGMSGDDELTEPQGFAFLPPFEQVHRANVRRKIDEERVFLTISA